MKAELFIVRYHNRKFHRMTSLLYMSKTLYENFPQVVDPPQGMKPHPENIQIFGLRLFKDASFISIPVISPHDSNSVYSNRFYCSECNKWLKMSGTIGNIRSHLKCVHMETMQQTQENISSFERIQLFKQFCLITGLPFRTIDHPIIQKLFPGIGNRIDLSHFCSEVSSKIRNYLKIKLQSALYIAIAIDEWSDQSNRRYLGMQGICIFQDAYEIVTLAQTPIFELNANANVISSIVKKNLKRYNIKDKVDYIVSDTTPVMPAAATLLQLNWSPCYCHILNLVAGDFTKFISMIIDPILAIQKKLGRSTVFTQFCIQKSRQYTRYHCLQKLAGIVISEHYMLLKN